MKDLIKKLSNNNIDFQQYVALYSLFHDDLDYIKDYSLVESYGGTSSIQGLIHLGFLQRLKQVPGTMPYNEVLSGNIVLTKLAIERFFKPSTSAPKSENLLPRYKVAWIEDWYDLFPKGIKSGGYYVRTSIKECDKKMFRFLTDNPTFTKDLILAATKNYVEDMKSKSYSMMKLAPNFILKDGVSMLSGCCEAYVEGVNSNQDTYNELTGI